MCGRCESSPTPVTVANVKPGPHSPRGAASRSPRRSLWNLRVLAGWLPRDGVVLLRTLAAWFELANVDEMLAAGNAPAFDLGALETAWSRLAAAASVSGSSLAVSAWQDPGGDGAPRCGLACGSATRRAAGSASQPSPGRPGAAAMLLAGERLAAGRVPDRGPRRGAARRRGCRCRVAARAAGYAAVAGPVGAGGIAGPVTCGGPRGLGGKGGTGRPAAAAHLRARAGRGAWRCRAAGVRRVAGARGA